ncbi:MAG TPA: hypothetical protein ENK43_10270 [Planctomycetes bacterium]|nr:hypothetical protein [Planctomycetota bacterium]
MKLTFLSILFLATAVTAQTMTATPKDYERKIRRLKPGMTLHLQPGTYENGMRLVGLHGNPALPLRIEGEKGVLFLARKGRNTIQLTDASYIEISSLTLDGRGLDVDGIKAGGNTKKGVHHITIEDCVIRGYGSWQFNVGISTKVPAWDWIIRRNIIDAAGTGLYLGNSDGTQAFVGGLIEGNVVKNCLGYDMQIKHQIRRDRVPGMPKDRRVTTIRYNVFLKNDVQGDKGDRPNLLVSGPPDDGPGSEDRYEIYGNLFAHNPREVLLQGAGRLRIHDNVFVDCADLAIRIRPHHEKRPLAVAIFHNTFVDVKAPWAVVGLAAKAERLFFGNIGDSRPAGDQNIRLNVWKNKTTVRSILAAPYAPWGKKDVHPRRPLYLTPPPAGMKLLRSDPLYALDFAGQRREKLEECGALRALPRGSKGIPLDREHPRSALKAR